MKRVWLREIGDPAHNEDGSLFVRSELVHRASLSLAHYATDGDRGRLEGDPVFEAVTEGRQSSNTARRAKGSKEMAFSACAEMIHWGLANLGVADESLVNRDKDDWGQNPWKSQVAISRIFNHKAFTHNKPAPPGSPIFVTAAEHVAILESWNADHITSFDYGQFNPKKGKFSGEKKVRALKKAGRGWTIGGRPYVGYLDLTKLRYMRFAEVPEDFEGGLPIYD